MSQTAEKSGIEEEVQDVAIFADIALALGPHLARFLGTLLSVGCDIIVISDCFCADEPLFKVAVDHARRLRSSCPGPDGPGARLLGSHGEIGFQFQQLVAGPDQTIETRLGDPSH